MLKWIVLFGVLVIMGCGDENPDTVVVPVGPKLSKIDCSEYANRVAEDVAARGLGLSASGAQEVQKARQWCIEENRRRGY